MKVELKILDPRLTDQLPRYQTVGSAGMDLLAALAAPCELAPDQVQLIPSGIAIHLADPAYCALILPRSGLGHKGLVLGNLVGLIDSDYQGEITLSAWNRSQQPITIEPLMRLAQLVVVPVAHASWQVVDQFAPSQRGAAGYGSTGM